MLDRRRSNGRPLHPSPGYPSPRQPKRFLQQETNRYPNLSQQAAAQNPSRTMTGAGWNGPTHLAGKLQ